MLALPRFVGALVSGVILALAAYLLWTWYEGVWVRDPAVDLVRVRDDWRLWTGGALALWSLLGRWIVLGLVARGGGRKMELKRGQGKMVAGASGSSLYVESDGPPGAPVLLFTHGWGMDGSFWTYARQDLGSRFRIVVWDLPGLGRSRAPGGRITLSNFAKDLRGLMATIDRPVVLVGHSIGGMTIETLARDQPDALDQVAGVVLLNTTFTNPLRTMVGAGLLRALQKPVLEPAMWLTVALAPLVWLSKWQSYLSGATHAAMRLGFGRSVTRSQLESVSLLSTRAHPAVEAKGDLAMFGWDATGVLRRLGKPLLVIGGDMDIVTKPEASRAMAADGAGRLEIIEGVNHMGPLEAADRYNHLIASFAGSLDHGGRHGDGRHPANVAVG